MDGEMTRDPMAVSSQNFDNNRFAASNFNDFCDVKRKVNYNTLVQPSSSNFGGVMADQRQMVGAMNSQLNPLVAPSYHINNVYQGSGVTRNQSYTQWAQLSMNNGG